MGPSSTVPVNPEMSTPNTGHTGTPNLTRRNSNPDWGEMDIPFKEYNSDAPIEDLVRDTVNAYHRGPAKAGEWLDKLKNQDIMTVGDLKALQDSDWNGFGLTVF